MPLTRKRGKYWYGYTRVDGVSSREQATGCEDRTAAEKVIDGWERDAADPHRAAQRRATLDGALKRLSTQHEEDAKAGQLAEVTPGMYEGKAAVVKTVFAALEPPVTMLSEINAGAVLRYLSARRAQGISDHTTDKEFTTLRKALHLARAHNEFGAHWVDLKPVGFSARYEPETDFLYPEALNLLLSELLPDHAARTAWMVATSGEWIASTRALRADLELVPTPVRGSKRETRNRRVPIFLSWQKELLAYAKEHAQGEGAALFEVADVTAFGHALKAAVDRINARPIACALLARVSANDLRRTFGMWMRAQGVAVSDIALMMGHTDSRMAERVYARIPAELLQQLLQSLVCQPAADQILAKMAEMPVMPGLSFNQSGMLAPRPGFEPGTYGLTVLARNWARPRYDRVCRRTSRPTAIPLPGEIVA